MCLIPYEATPPDLVHRTEWHGGRPTDTIIGGADAGVPGTLVRDIAGASLGAATAAVVLPQWYEPDRFREMWREQSTKDRVASHLIVTVVADDHLFDGLIHDDTLHFVDLHQDDTDVRTIGDIVARQVEQGDCVVAVGTPEGDDPWRPNRSTPCCTGSPPE